MLIAFSFTIIHLLSVVFLEVSADSDKNLNRKIELCRSQSKSSSFDFYLNKNSKRTRRHKTYCIDIMDNKNTKTKTTSKYFSTKDSEMNSKNRKRSKDEEDEITENDFDHQGSQNSETLEYSLKGAYVDEDFMSGEESDTGEKMNDLNVDDSKKNPIDISDDSTDDENNAKPWKEEETNVGKYKLRQTTLNFFKKGKKETPGKGAPSENSQKKRKYNDSDTMNYRSGYPGKTDDPSAKNNLYFYKGLIQSRPDGDLIDNIHQMWHGDYRLLERHHGYIQWLFPIREGGMNWHAQELQLHEAEAIQNDPELKEKVLTSYQLMLDFYGMELASPETGKIKRSKNWKSRFDNLNFSTHNYLRITRILKCLGEMGWEHLKTPFLEFVIDEGLVKRTLVRAMRSCHDYWIGTVKDDKERVYLYDLMNELTVSSW